MRYKGLTKLNIKAMIISITACAFGLSLLLPTMTWFADETASKINVDGNIHGSYFESGDGTAANPFEIARPIQLYYLSWLQEMGYFNEAVQNTTTGEWELKQQYHFYLSKDIDMNVQGEDPYLLPPIGTIEYPFIGSFDGKGHVITDLVITNDVSEYTNDPRTDNNGNNISPSYEILGLFGVLGTTESTNVVSSSYIDSSGYIHKLTDTTTGDDITVAFQNSGNYVTNIYLDNVTIVAAVDSNKALAGAVAGYSNATVSNIGIHGATLTFANGRAAVSDIGTSNLSDYAAFGFVTQDHKREVKKVEKQVYEPKATANTYVANSAGNEWGGSVNFQSMNRRMYSTRYMKVSNNNNNNPSADKVLPYPIRQTYVDNVLQREATSTDGANILNGENLQDTYFYSDANAVGKSGARNTIGSYYYVWSSSGNRLYLGGLSDIGASSVKWVTRINHTGDVEECYYIKNPNNTYVGISSSGTLADDTNKTTLFHYNSVEQCLYARKTVSNFDTVYFLNIQNGALLIERTSNTAWTKNPGTNTFTGQPKWKFKIKNGSNYMKYRNTTSVENTQDADAATYWNISNHGTSNRESGIYTTQGNETYYLNYSGNSGDSGSTAPATSLRLYRAQHRSWHRNSDSGTSGVKLNNQAAYLYLNATTSNGNTTYTWQNSTSDSQSFDLVQDTSTISASYETGTDNSYTFTITQEKSGQPGYIPLSAVGDYDKTNYKSSGTKIEHLYAAEKNTGYLIGGFYDSSNGGKNFLAGKYYGDARVSLYNREFINQSWTTSGFTTLWTIDDTCYSGTGDDASQEAPRTFTKTDSFGQSFVKLSESSDNLDKILRTDSSNVAGIHFMDATISMEKTIRASAVMINGDYKTDYEMPEDSIDFNLKENGYINFFAGNYHSDNNSFFALHKIERDSNDNITSIKKIKYIFKDANDPLGDCIYLYDDEGSGYAWSDGENLSIRPVAKTAFSSNGKNYVFAFDTKWIGKNQTLIPKKGGTVNATSSDDQFHRLYYFEIPVTVGEYALGSCSGACGGYLIYLDISASSQVIERKTLHELFEVNILSGDIPYGTQYVGTIPTPQPVLIPNSNEEDKTAIVRTDIQNIDDLESYYGSIDSSANGNYTINRNGDTITVTGSNALTSDYIADDLTLSGGTTGGRTSRIIRRIIDYDYNTIVDSYVKQTTTIEIIGTGNTAHNYATTTLEYNMVDFDNPYTTIATYSYDWIGDGPNFQYSYYLIISNVAGSPSSIEVNFINPSNDNFNLTVSYLNPDFKLTCSGDTTVLTSSDIPSVPDENNPYPTIPIAQSTSSTYKADQWYDFTKQYGGYNNSEQTVTPTVIATFRYTTEGSENIEENFVYSGYTSLGEPTAYGETPTVITVTNGSYTYEFILSGSSPTSSQQDPAVTIYYVAQGVYVVRMGNGSEYILIIDESQQP